MYRQESGFAVPLLWMSARSQPGPNAGYNARMEVLFAIGIGGGLASVAGVRAFLPLLLAFVFSYLGFFEPSGAVSGPVGGWEGRTVGITGALAGLALLEIVLDKVRVVERVFNMVMVPLRAISGALLVAALAPTAGAVLWLAIGAVIAGVVAVLKVVQRPPASTPSSGVSTSFLSLIEDLVGLIGGAVAFFVPYLPVLLVAFLLFFFSRIRKRRGKKFGGLRILGD